MKFKKLLWRCGESCEGRYIGGGRDESAPNVYLAYFVKVHNHAQQAARQGTGA